jgi:hypothetical protein
MTQAQNIPQHNYIRKIEQLWRTGALPRSAGYHQLTVDHDNWCGIFDGRHCNCEPDIALKFSLTGVDAKGTP